MTSGEGRGRSARRPPIDARTLGRWVRSAGEAALREAREGRGEDAAAALARADRAVVHRLRSAAAESAPDMAVLSAGIRGAGDPRAGWSVALSGVDGGDAFAAGVPTWAVSVGILDHGLPVAGAVYLPAFEDLYVAYGGVMKWNGKEVPVGGIPPRRPGFILAFSEFHRRRLVGLRGRRMRSLGSTAYHLSLVARGAADGAIVGHAHLWDIAAGAALLAVAGGDLVYLGSGEPVDLRAFANGSPARDDMVAARSGALASVLDQIRRRR